MAQGSVSVSAPQMEQMRMCSRASTKRLREMADAVGIALGQMQGQALGRARADAGQAAQRLGQS